VRFELFVTLSLLKSETRNPKSERNPNVEARIQQLTDQTQQHFGFRFSGFFRISDFEFRLWITSLQLLAMVEDKSNMGRRSV